MTTILSQIYAHRWFKTYVLTLIMALFLTYIGAMDMGRVPFMTRLIYWLITMLAGALIAQGVAKFFDRYFLGWSELWGVVLINIALIPVVSAMVWAFTAFYFQFKFRIETLPMFILPVGIISLAMTGLHFLAERQPQQSHTYPVVEGPVSIRLLERLEKRFAHAEILAIASEDHYLRVYTTMGDSLILMRLYDAIEALDGIEGSQVHRSWWVAKSAITDTVRKDGRPQFKLQNGLLVPISRTFIKALRQDGWLS